MNAGAIDVRVEGTGPDAIVMIHGWPDTWRLWDRQVAALSARYRCVRFTLPGFDLGGPRRAFSLDEVIEAIRSVVEQASCGEPVTLLLHDWGCFFGYQFATRHPELARRVVGVDVGDAGSRAHLRELGATAKAGIAAYQLWLALAWRIGGRAGDWMSQTMARAARCPTDRESIGWQMAYPYYVLWTRSFGGYRDAHPFVPACPTLFIYGRRKPFMFHSTAWADALAAKPGCRVLGFDAGHWVMVDEPDAFNRAVADWMRDVRPPPAN